MFSTIKLGKRYSGEGVLDWLNIICNACFRLLLTLWVLLNGGVENSRKSVNISNEWKKRHKCLILMLKLKVSKQTRSEANKNKVSNNQKGIKHTNKLSESM